MNTHELNDLVDRQYERIGELETERDALVAQTKRCVDLLTHVLKQFEKHELGEELDSEEDALAWAEKARAAISDTPTTSIARRDYRRCHTHSGDDCELCGGAGWRKRCRKAHCIEHGCDGGTYCAVSPQESAELRRQAEGGHDDTPQESS